MKRKKSILILSLIATTAIGYLIYQIQKKPYHLRTVVPNVLYRSGTLSSYGFRKFYKSVKLRSIIDLRSQKELTQNKNGWYSTEERFAKQHRIKIYHLKMLYNTPPTSKQIESFLDIMENPKNFPALIHCQEGIDRTGMMIAIYDMTFLHENNFMAFKKLPMFGHSWLDKRREKTFILDFNPKKYF